MFLSRIEPVLQDIQGAVQELNDYKQMEKWSLKIGISPMIGAYLVPKVVLSFQREYPNADIFLYEESSSSICDKLDSYKIDFGIDFLGSTSFSVLPLCKSQLMVCVSESNPIADTASISVNDVSIIMPREGNYIRGLIQEKLGDIPHIALETDQVITVKKLVAEDAGIAFLPDFMANDTPGVRALPFSSPVYLDIGLAWKSGSYCSKAMQSFIDFCKKLSEDLCGVEDSTLKVKDAGAIERGL